MSDIGETIEIDNTSYDVDSLSDRARHIISQIKECTKQTREFQLKTEVSEVARIGFVDLLKQEIGHTSPPKPEEETPDEQRRGRNTSNRRK